MSTGRLRWAFVLALATLPVVLVGRDARAQADNTSQARDHYRTGNQLFARGDYEGAIAEFAEADRLAPSPLLEYNIGLCYDRLGDREEALRRYRVYLRELPTAKNRESVEAKIRRLEGELRAENAPPVTTPPVTTPPVTTPPAVTDTPPAVTDTPPAETPPTTDLPAAVSPSDPELARVDQIDVMGIVGQRRQARTVGSEVSSPPNAVPPPGGAIGSTAGGPPEAAASPNGTEFPKPDAPKKADKPLYKQWWFWVVAGVGAIILIDFATSDSSSQNTRALILPPPGEGGLAAPQPGGLEWHF